MGVKGYSAFSKIMPDFIKGMAIDHMHCVDGGVIKKILTLLTDAKYKSNVFSLYAVIDEINSRLTAIKPPKFIHHIPRTIVDLTLENIRTEDVGVRFRTPSRTDVFSSTRKRKRVNRKRVLKR